jgi:hypothetical protein
MRHATMPRVPGVYIESSYAGHKAPPGKYRVTITAGGQKLTAEAEILANPLYPTTPETYREYHQTMLAFEAEVTTMHNMVNRLFEKQKQLESLIGAIPAGGKFAAIKSDADALLKSMKEWDDAMVQRKSRAYDDVENFPNRFTADYLFMINQTESDIPRVNQPSIDLAAKMNARWATLKSQAEEIENRRIPELNKRLFDAGIGAIWKSK